MFISVSCFNHGTVTQARGFISHGTYFPTLKNSWLRDPHEYNVEPVRRVQRRVGVLTSTPTPSFIFNCLVLHKAVKFAWFKLRHMSPTPRGASSATHMVMQNRPFRPCRMDSKKCVSCGRDDHGDDCLCPV